jgi:uncharacterized protein (DUF58 family)
MNTKLNFILLIVISLFLTALVSRNGSLTLLAIPFLVYLAAGLLFSPEDIQLLATRTLSALRSNENEPIKMLLAIENNGPAIHRLQLYEPIQPNMYIVEGSLEQCFTISAGEKVELHYTFQIPRGRYTWQTIKLIASDPFGLFENIQNLPAEANTLVLPEQAILKRFKFHPKPTVRTAGPYLSRMAGSGIDFWGVREYHPGDSLRLIHWRKTARHPRCFFSKEFEREEMADIGLLLDTRAVTNQYFGTENLFEYSIHAAATLAKFFLSSGNRVSMLLLSDHLARIFPGYGKRQLVRILDQLAGCKLGERVTLETLKYLPGRLFPGHSVIVIISPLRSQDFSTIARLHAKGYQLLLLRPSPAKSFLTDHSKSTFDSFSIRATNLERAVLLKRFQQIGIQVIDWNVDQSLIQTLQSARLARK